MVSAVAPVGEFRCIQKRAPLFTDQYLGLYLAVGLAALGTALQAARTLGSLAHCSDVLRMYLEWVMRP